MAAMASLYDLATQAMFGSFKESQRDPYVYNWLNTRYARIWTGFDWAFKHVEPAAISAVAGVRYLGAAASANPLPTDFLEVSAIYDENGDETLDFLEEKTFHRAYLGARIAGQNGTPQHYTVVNGKIILGPVPNVSKTYYLGYRRKLGFDKGDVGGGGGAGTFQVGLMGSIDATKDNPYWPHEHWEILVVGARATGLKLVNDTAWFSLEQQHDDLVAGMLADGLLHDETGPGNHVYGRDSL